MLLALIAPGDFESRKRKAEPSLEERLAEAAWRSAAREQALAIAQRMLDEGPFEGCLLCREGGILAQEAGRLGLPCLPLRSGSHPLDMLRLWRWQKRHPRMLALSMDGAGLRIAASLKGMRGKGGMPLAASFLMRPPDLGRKELKILAAASVLIGGSDLIVEKLAMEMERHRKPAWPGSSVIAPGLDRRRFGRPKAWEAGAGRNFVFGMAEALGARSGALLVIRAMGALWQREGLPPFEIRMFGAGPRFGEILEEARNLGVISRLSLLCEQDLASAAPACQAWLAPGASALELPGTLWAGFAARLPVICSASPLHLERLPGALRQGAILAEENNPQNLAKAMISVMGGAGLRQALVEAGGEGLEAIGLSRMASEVADQLLGIL